MVKISAKNVVDVTIYSALTAAWIVVFYLFYLAFFDNIRPADIIESDIVPNSISQGVTTPIAIKTKIIPNRSCHFKRSRYVSKLDDNKSKEEYLIGFVFMTYSEDQVGKADDKTFEFKSDPNWKKGFYKFQTNNEYQCNLWQQLFPLTTQGKPFYFVVK